MCWTKMEGQNHAGFLKKVTKSHFSSNQQFLKPISADIGWNWSHYHFLYTGVELTALVESHVPGKYWTKACSTHASGMRHGSS